MDVEPKTPTVEGGNHVNAKKSNVHPAADKKMAITKRGLKNTDRVKGMVLLCFLVLGSCHWISYWANFWKFIETDEEMEATNKNIYPTTCKRIITFTTINLYIYIFKSKTLFT